jgi:hypothetical protein
MWLNLVDQAQTRIGDSFRHGARPQNRAPHGFATVEGALRGLAPVEGVAEDQAEGDVDAPQVRTYRPEPSVRSEGSATMLPRLPPSYCTF